MRKRQDYERLYEKALAMEEEGKTKGERKAGRQAAQRIRSRYPDVVKKTRGSKGFSSGRPRTRLSGTGGLYGWMNRVRCRRK